MIDAKGAFVKSRDNFEKFSFIEKINERIEEAINNGGSQVKFSTYDYPSILLDNSKRVENLGHYLNVVTSKQESINLRILEYYRSYGYDAGCTKIKKGEYEFTISWESYTKN